MLSSARGRVGHALRAFGLTKVWGFSSCTDCVRGYHTVQYGQCGYSLLCDIELT